MHSHGETNVTVGAGSLPNVEAMTTNASKWNSAHFITSVHISLHWLCEACSNLYTELLLARIAHIASMNCRPVRWTLCALVRNPDTITALRCRVRCFALTLNSRSFS